MTVNIENSFSSGSRPLVVGNWKMHGTGEQLSDLAAIDAIAAEIDGCEAVICPPATLLSRASAAVSHVAIGAQDCHAAPSGPHTGSVSVAMLAEAGARWAIVGHSETRQAHGLDDAAVAAKLEAATAMLQAILCVGETSCGEAGGLAALASQVRNAIGGPIVPGRLTVAYEPVWAIGSGKVPDPLWIAEVHAAVRQVLVARFPEEGRAIRVLYGGSVTSENAGVLCAIEGVDGVLVGGASLCAGSFGDILRDVNGGSD